MYRALLRMSLPTAAAFITSAVAFAAPQPKTITVSEGTNMQVTISPDHKSLLVNIQGLIYSMPATGGAGKQLTQPLQEASHPDWSSHGDLVALQSYAGGTFHIWTMKPDGTGLKQVTTGHGDDREPRLSPDGTTIAFSSDRAFKGSYDIWTVKTDGSDLKQITDSPADEYEPNWAHDGKHLVFVSGVGIQAKAIETVDLAGGHAATIASVDPTKARVDAPSYSPDDSKIAYILFDGGGMFLDKSHVVVASPSAASTPLYTGKADDAFPFPAVWLTNKELLYTGSGKIIKADIASDTESSVPFTAAVPSTRPQFAHKKYDFDETSKHLVKGIYAPTLSPDGKKIAFVALNQLYLMTIGQAPVALTSDTFYKQGPTFSTDGKYLAYISDRDGIENIYVHDMSHVDAANDKRIAPSESAQIMPAWSPDGKMIAFQDQTGATLLADVATGTISPLAPITFFPGRAAFSPNGKKVAIATINPYTKRFREGTSDILMVDLATKKTKFYSPAPYESVTTRTEDGPIYAPNGKEIAFVLRDLLYTMPVDADGDPIGKAVKLNDETTDAPTWSGDSSKLLYLSNGKLRLIDRATGKITPVPVDLTFTQAKPTQKLLIHAGQFWKGSGPEVMKDVDILIVDNRIVSIKPHSATPYAGVTKTIEAPNSTVMPGLFENHVHADSDNGIYYGDRMGRLWLIYGVTELRGIADNAYRALEHRESYTADVATGPRVFNTGEAVDGERVYYPMMIATTSEEQLHREFGRLKALDFDFVKLYVRLPFAWAKEGIDFAHSQMGVETASHYLLPAVSLGEDGMSHLSATSRWGWAYSRSLTGHSYGDVRKLLVDSGMWTISTTFSQAPYADDPGMATDPRQAVAPPWENKRLKTAVQMASKSGTETMIDHLSDEESVVADVYHQGGMIVAGTDSPLDIPATSLHINLRAQVKYGHLEPWQALETVTSIPAKAYGLSRDLGTLEPGKLADLIIVSGDPLKNIEDAAKVQCVAKNGNLESVGAIMAPFAKSTKGEDICPAK
ncbi:MAG: amidohydrolase family protein [Edaphobacter sp.]|uniref:amidohydrolase family protein n=1 Tax=Edaphobacter sp. TaxID=1934404 RepID=UPI002383F1D7|nr:amidohydrolase family protein [Edaphobacter sp.]MDE1176023.1 amidohydrolase family protein [Edaphobacter sp.]